MRFHLAVLVFSFATFLPKVCLGEAVEFNRDIRPILAEKCFQCHGPDSNSREADLRLDVVDESTGPFADRDGTVAIQPRDLELSSVWQRVNSKDEDEVMPPPDSHKEPLSAEQLSLLKRWIMDGAEYQDHWAFLSPKSQTAPNVSNKAWRRNRIDRFVLERLDREGISPKLSTNRRTLIRRLTFDLTGLPPTREEIREFRDDTSPDAYAKLIDHLIESPRYGEHMAKYWLDLVRFADTNGIHHDHYREMTPYRDWVIRSFNDNLPFDRFIIDQVAGDLYGDPTVNQQIASGFNRLHLVIDKGTAIPEESFTRNVIDRVTAVGTAFMGMTVGCAVCHDHKYDPVTQKDFYQLYAFFNNIDSGPETPGSGTHAPFIRLPTAEQQAQLSSIESQIESLEAQINKAKDNEADTGSKEEELKQLKKSRTEFETTIPVSLVMKEREEVRATFILNRGAYDQPGAAVERDTPSFLPPLTSEGDVKSRMDLAKWLTSANHPLTSRVTVNRFWQQFFGVGLVKTSEDFGTQGEWPSHPALLDDLSVNFMESGWDVKAFVKLIVSSQTYQQSSQANSEEFKKDPQNRLLARGSRFRLDAETIRDQILSVSGLLNEKMFGKSVKPPQPPNLWKNVSMRSSSTYAFKADTGPKIYRRSLYSFWKRALPPPQMTIFDAPTREACTARRERTNTPLQALVLMNEEQYFKATRHFAQGLLAEQDLTDKQRIDRAYESITSHPPDEEEMSQLITGLDSFRQTYRGDPDAAKNLTSDIALDSDHDRTELAALTMLVNTLFSLDVAKTRE